MTLERVQAEFAATGGVWSHINVPFRVNIANTWAFIATANTTVPSLLRVGAVANQVPFGDAKRHSCAPVVPLRAYTAASLSEAT
jgi:hypothetical protein